MKRIISFCLWGDNSVYWHGALSNAHLAKALFPGWICRFHIASDGLPENDLHQLRQLSNVEIVAHPGSGDPLSMLWRFEEADDEDVEIFISRDTDSRLSIREKLAIEAWLHSGKRYHVMRDHPYHRTAMLGGMWGMLSHRNGKMRERLKRWRNENTLVPQKGIDQNFLSTVIWPEAKRNTCTHDPFFSGRAFPDEVRDPTSVYFVGECFTAHGDFASQSDRDALDQWQQRRHRPAWLRRLWPSKF